MAREVICPKLPLVGQLYESWIQSSEYDQKVRLTGVEDNQETWGEKKPQNLGSYLELGYYPELPGMSSEISLT